MSGIYSAVITATVLPSGCTDEVIWESDDTTVATVTPIANTNTATVTALKAGTCNITVTCGDYSDTCAVTVQTSGPVTSGEFFTINFTQGNFVDGTWVPDTDRWAVSEEISVTPGKVLDIEVLGNPDDYTASTSPALTALVYSGSHTDLSSISNPVLLCFPGRPVLWHTSYYTNQSIKTVGGGALIPEGYDHARIIVYGYGNINDSVSVANNTLAKLVNDGIKWTMTTSDDLTPVGTASGLIQEAGGISGSGTTEIFKASSGHIYFHTTTSTTTTETATGLDNPPTSTTTYSDFSSGSTSTGETGRRYTSVVSGSNSNYLYVSHPSSKHIDVMWRGIVKQD